MANNSPSSSPRLVDPEAKQLEKFDLTLRPKTLAEYIGQEKIKNNLKIFIEAARRREEPLEHVLLYGPPGLGKTTLANIIASEMSANIKITSGPTLEHGGDLAAILTNLAPGDVLFIDEIHRLNKTIEEILYPAMENYCLDIIIGKGPSARTVRLNLPPFTLIGATTRFGALSSPLRDRFGNVFHLNFYENHEIEKIVRRASGLLNINADPDSIEEIAKRSRRTPRIANRLLKRIRDFAAVENNGLIDPNLTKTSLDRLEIDFLGLDEVDRKILKIIIEKFNGGPVGINTIAAATAEEIETIENVYEPFLLRLGFLDRTPQGRKITPLAYRHLGINHETAPR